MIPEDLIRQKIAAGHLPCQPCRVIWAGPGADRPCAVCGHAVSAQDTEYECGQADGSVIYFHYECYVLWDAACRELQSGSPI